MRLFTPDEANALVPELKRRLAALREAWHAFEFAREQWREAVSFEGETSAEALRWQEEVAKLRGQLEPIWAALADLGAEVKDPILGLVDFHGRRADGSIVYLCYRDDEEAIRFWHPMDTGFMGRRPLTEF